MVEDIDVDSDFYDTYPSIHNDQSKQYYDANEFNALIHDCDDPSSTLKVLNLNIQSLSAKEDNFLSYFETLNVNFDIICLTETWMQKDDLRINFLPDYQDFNQIRLSSRGGGVSIYIENTIQARILKQLSCTNDNFECIFVEISTGTTRTVICSCYRPPTNSSVSQFVEDFTEKLRLC